MNNSKITSEEVIQAAVSYAQMGFSVIPVTRDKKPLVPWKEWQSKRADEAQIRTWFRQYPKANVGIITGAISGIVVVDVEAGGEIADLSQTATVQTGGGGWHLYYKYNPDRPIKNYSRLREKTDIRAEGGYVVAPPSIHQSGREYTWGISLDVQSLADFPYWILTSPTRSLSSQCSDSSEGSQGFKRIFEGSRNDAATRKAGEIIGKLDPARWEAEGWPQFKQWNEEKCLPPLEEKELRGVWNSIINSEKNKNQAANSKKRGAGQCFEIYSKRFRSGQVVESYFDPEKEETGLIIFWQGQVATSSCICVDGVTYSAPPAKNSLIATGFVKMPSMASPYESEAALLWEIKKFIHDYVQIPGDFEQIASFYVLLSWVYDEFQELPYLRAIGDFGSGKSRFLKVMGALCYRPVFLNGNTSSSAIFRIINDVKGTIILDEADFKASDTSSEIIKILNSGFQKGIPVFRSEARKGDNKSFDPIPYDVFCPKVIATRKDFTDDALESRCLNNAMETLTRDDIPENLDDDFDFRALDIRNKLVSFRFQKLDEGISREGLPKLNIEPRLRQIISPIYRVVSDVNCKQMILELAKKKQQEVINNRFTSMEGELLQAFLTIQENIPEPTMKEIAEKYNEQFGGKYPIKPKRVGSVVDQIFHLQKRKGSNGFFVCNTEENERRIQKLKEKYGIDKPEVNIVNIVNIPEKSTPSQLEEAEKDFGLESSDTPF